MLNQNQPSKAEQAQFSALADQPGQSHSLLKEIQFMNRQSGHISLQQLDGILIWIKRLDIPTDSET